MSKAGKHGITENTPKNIPFGAGTIHKNLKYTEGEGWNFDESIVGATTGGSKYSVIPEINPIEVDGVSVRVKGLDRKTGETAKMEINFAEYSPDLIKTTIIGKEATSEDATYTKIVTKPDVEEGDYWDNVAFVGETLKGQKIIVIMGNALCTNGLEGEGKNKENGTMAVTFECSADLDEDSDLDVLPVEIYYPKSN